MTLTQSRLCELFAYDRDTGIFTRKVTVQFNARAGDIAGTLTSDGYLTIQIDGNQYQAHRLAWLYENGEFPDCDLDHEDTVKTNNRINNLRLATSSQNNANKRRQANNKSGFKGVSLYNGGPKWRADVKIDGKKKYLGCFSTPEQAHEAYVGLANNLYGEFARAA